MLHLAVETSHPVRICLPVAAVAAVAGENLQVGPNLRRPIRQGRRQGTKSVSHGLRLAQVAGGGATGTGTGSGFKKKQEHCQGKWFMSGLQPPTLDELEQSWKSMEIGDRKGQRMPFCKRQAELALGLPTLGGNKNCRGVGGL